MKFLSPGEREGRAKRRKGEGANLLMRHSEEKAVLQAFDYGISDSALSHRRILPLPNPRSQPMNMVGLPQTLVNLRPYDPALIAFQRSITRSFSGT